MNKEAKMTAWMARDEDDYLHIFFDKKPKKKLLGYWGNEGQFKEIPKRFFPQVQWEDEKPVKVELTIKIK